MKRSRSGTASPRNAPRTSTIVLLVALAIVLAFAASFVFGLRGDEAEPAVTREPVSAPQQPAVVSDNRARVEVLNAAGQAGLARSATDMLRAAGFDVVQFGNARELSATSQVLDRVGNLSSATEIGQALGIADVKSAVDTTRYVDVTVILGRHWRGKSAGLPVR
ncbi:MAG: LytR C-terminal domain-containing protein [Gemmatimonadota bacterium]